MDTLEIEDEEDVRPLVSDGNIEALNAPLTSRKRPYSVVALAAVLLVAVVVRGHRTIPKSAPAAPAPSIPSVSPSGSKPESTSRQSKKEIPELITSDLKEISELQRRFREGRQQVAETLKTKYGPETFQKVFYLQSGVSIGKTAYLSENSRPRLVKRMIQKLLDVVASAGNIAAGTTARGIPMVWATGGHSAAAGHGNLFEESYTRYMEELLDPVLSRLGISIEARNYAMGGTSSAPEVAMCSREIFGDDIDILTWDYGMTDGRNFMGMELYFRRAAVDTRGKASFLALNIGGRALSGRQSVMQKLDEMGLTALYLDPGQQDRIVANMPDTFGKTETEIEEMPVLTRYFKCQGKVEKGDPGCGSHKFNTTVCPKRRAKTSWHPGWRSHSLQGHLNAMFLLDLFEDALSEMGGKDSDARSLQDNPSSWKKTIDEEFVANYEKFLSTPVSPSAKLMFGDKGKDGVDIQFSDAVFQSSRKICHTARLPSQARYQGLVTDLEPFHQYNVTRSIAPTDDMRLVQDDSTRDDCEVPPEQIQIDYKDYFFVNAIDDWKSVTVPNDKENDAYGDMNLKQGFIILCLAACSWNRCPRGMVVPKNWQDVSEIKVNNVPVVNMTAFQSCQALSHAGGHSFSAKKGRFEVLAKVTDGESFFKISSIIVLE